MKLSFCFLRPTFVKQRLAGDFALALVCLSIMAYAIFLRFVGISSIGLPFSTDIHQYVQHAVWWMDGEYRATFPFRPVTNQLHAFALRIIGLHDYSIIALHALLDCISILLIYILARRIYGKSWLILCPLVVYSFFSASILNARDGMLTSPATTFTLLLTYLLLLYVDFSHQRKSYELYPLCAAGLVYGLSILVHQSLAFLGPPAVIVLLSSVLRNTNVDNASPALGLRIRALSVKCSLFFSFALLVCAIYFLPVSKDASYALSLLYTKISDANSEQPSEAVSKTTGAVAACYHSSMPETTLNAICRPLRHYTGNDYLTNLFTLSVIVMCLLPFLGKSIPSHIYIPVIIVLGFAASYGFAFEQFREKASRISFPIIPLLLIHTFWFLEFLFRYLVGRWSTITCLCIAIAVTYINPHIISAKDRRLYPYSLYRDVHNQLGDLVDENNKLLITPWAAYRRDMGCLQSPLYFGKNAVYLSAASAEGKKSFEEIVADSSISYIILLSHNQRFWLYRLRNQKDPYGFREAGKEYNYTKEKDYLKTFFREAGASLLSETSAYEIYEFNSAPHFSPGSRAK